MPAHQIPTYVSSTCFPKTDTTYTYLPNKIVPNASATNISKPDTSSSTFQVKGLRLNPKGTAVIVGNVASNWEPVRNKQSKYYISENQVIQEGSLSSYE